MLNEFFSILQGLKAVDAPLETKHPDIQEPGNNTTFRVVLGPDGDVQSVKLLNREQIQQTWSWGNNQNQFPAVKVKKPLIPSARRDFDKWKKSHPSPSGDDYRALLKSSIMPPLNAPIEHIESWPDGSHRQSIIARKDVLKRHQPCRDIYELFHRFCKSETGVEILVQTRDLLIAEVRSGSNTDYSEVCSLLFGSELKSGTKEEVVGTNRVTLLLDCLPSDEVRIYASSKEHVRALSDALFEEESGKQKDAKKGACSITGTSDFLVGTTFPKEKFAVVGSTIIFAKSHATSGLTVKRYGKSEADAFPLSRQLSYELPAAVAFLCRAEAKEKTWSQFAKQGKKGKPSLLLAFCREHPNVAVTPLITGETGAESEVENVEDFLQTSEDVLSAFKGHGVKFDHQVDFIEIAAIDKANRKVNFKTTKSVNELSEAAEDWEQACRNVPDVKLFCMLSNKERALCAPWPISPKQIMHLSGQKYIRGGTESLQMVGISFADTMKLFLGRPDTSFADALLQRIAEQYEPLLQRSALNRKQHMLTSGAQRVKVDPRLNTEALRAVTLMSVLLFKSGRTRETYMKGLLFQLGQLCSAMDELHIGYCVSQRNGDIPNTLLGNQAYGMALHSPKKALNFMAERLRPYDSWARSHRIKSSEDNMDKAVLAALGARRWIADHASSLANLIGSEEMSQPDGHKAELMLGYLAGRPFPSKDQPSNPTNGTGD